MLSRRVLLAARTARLCRSQQPLRLAQLPLMLQNARGYADLMVKVPQMAESITEGTLSQIAKKVGEQVEQDEEIATIETDKIDVSVTAPEAGVIKEILASEEDTVTVGQNLIVIETGGVAPEKAAAAEAQEASSTLAPAAESKPEAPKEDSKPAPPKQAAPEKSAPAPTPAPKKAIAESAAAPAVLGSREERRVKMNRMRLRIAERLKQSQNTAASLTTFNEVDMSSLMEFRKLYKDDVLKSTGVKLGFMSAFTRASVLAMRDIPAVNASIEGPNGGDTIVYRDYVDLSVAVATEKGLARDGKLTIEDMAGGTFTISNGGVFGSLMGTPIINLPQTAVLGLHSIKERATVVNGKVEARPMMYLALTYDHRLLDGREAVQFLVKVKEYIEDPRRMLL
ncbi:dihydrolipoamide acyltransferase [Grosmannia clavigera kw1407]|uniref:Dihydrolipoamide acetyltransferase component of pyruvate dehydrogenase complex n=1 Tax=Grosmannia clavigera (strain kw1407 / UAMH 11150) TaxID=655863 RepID=F0XNI8_GROCL|nr:dihydrolipoamide acyltransferase [Grosmannia clavigera kw1407]EFX00886.1 dihydrolipoamide acyltransferase [Grosmannia clavigera kw1407]